MKYSIAVLKTEMDYLWGIYEHATGLMIEVFFFEDEAQQAVSFYENGGAFDGFTPSFMLRTVSPQSDLNEAFEQRFIA